MLSVSGTKQSNSVGLFFTTLFTLVPTPAESMKYTPDSACSDSLSILPLMEKICPMVSASFTVPVFKSEMETNTGLTEIPSTRSTAMEGIESVRRFPGRMLSRIECLFLVKPSLGALKTPCTVG